MFKNEVQQHIFNSEIANTLFENIQMAYIETDYGYDTSLIQTLRALLGNRVNREESLQCYCYVRYLPQAQANVNTRDFLRYLGLDSVIFEDFKNCFNIIYLTGRQVEESDINALMGIGDIQGFKYINKANAYFKQKGVEVCCFINESNKRTVVFVLGDQDLRYHHLIQSGIPVFLPWYFEEKPISEIETRLLSSIIDGNYDAYIETLKKITTSYNMREALIKLKLKGFETCIDRHRIETIKRDIVNTEIKIKDYTDAIGRLLNEKRRCDIELCGLTQRTKEEGTDEIMHMFLTHKNLSLQSVNNDSMTFFVNDYLIHFGGEDYIQRVLENKNSMAYYPDGGHPSEEAMKDMKVFAKAAFVDKSIKLKTCGIYKLNLGGRFIDTFINFPYEDYADCYNNIPNPHLDEYHCLGQYNEIFTDLFNDANYEMIIETCISSARSLNFEDPPVMSRFFANLYRELDNPKRAFVELPDGRCVTAPQAVDWLVGDDKEAEEDENKTEVIENGESN